MIRGLAPKPLPFYPRVLPKHDLWSKLVFYLPLWDSGTYRELVSGIRFSPVGNARMGVGPSGRRVEFDGTDDLIRSDSPSFWDWERTQPFSVMVLFHHSVMNWSFLIGKQTVWANPGWHVSFDAGLPRLQLQGATAGQSLDVGTTGTALAAGQDHVLLITYDGSSTPAGIVFYSSDRSTWGTTTLDNDLASSILNTVPVTLGAFNNSTDDMSGSVYAAGIWLRVLSAVEIARLLRDPYLPLRVLRRSRFFVPPVAAAVWPHGYHDFKRGDALVVA